jgi:alpha-ketoglutaric semialdehyde dehydrogenase
VAHAQEFLVSLNPADPDDVVAELPAMGVAEVAILSGRLRAIRPSSDAATRASRLEELATALRATSGELSQLLTREVAKLPVEAEAEVEFAATIAEHYAELLRTTSDASPVRDLPVELAGVITPFNFPCSIAVMKVAAAYGAGASVLWKPSPYALALSTRLGNLFRPILEESCELVIAADEAPFLEIVGQVDALSFTGSGAGATLLWQAAASRPIPMQLELGSCNPTVIGEDFEAGAAAEILRISCFSYAGQKCSSTRRIVAPAERADKIFEALSAVLDREQVGNPADAETTIPPLISAESASRYELQLADWYADSASFRQLSTPHDLSDCYAPPTIALAERDSKAFQRDVFGPAVVVLPYRSFGEALELANGTPYGLFAGLLSHDQAEIDEFCAEVQAGILKINQPTPGLSARLPSQGWRGSGLGPGELGSAPFRPFLRVQTVYPH